MMRLKLGLIEDDKPVRLSVELPASVHRDLVAYAEALARENLQPNVEPAKLVAPMLARFMATDRAFATTRRRKASRSAPSEPPMVPAKPSQVETQHSRPVNPAQGPSPFFKLTANEPHDVSSPERSNEHG